MRWWISSVSAMSLSRAFRVVDDQKAGELAARLHERNDRLGACGERLSATTANLLDDVA